MSDPAPAPARTLTWRACATGLVLAVAVAVATPVNDWHLRNTALYNNYNPAIVTLIALALALVVNPLLGRFRFARGELAVILAVVLAIGGVVSGGLMRRHTAIMAGGPRALANEAALTPLQERGEDGTRWAVPGQLFVRMPASGPIDADDPEHRAVIGGYFTGGERAHRVGHRATVTWSDAAGVHTAEAREPSALAPMPAGALDLSSPTGRAFAGLMPGDTTPDGLRVLAVEPPGIPWDAWLKPALAWLPLLVSGVAALIAMSGVVRRQWIEHERLPYPIASVTLEYIADPAPGRRIAPIFTGRAFWWGFLITLGLLTWKGVAELGWFSLGLQTSINLTPLFADAPWFDLFHWWFFLNWHLWFSVVALTFFLPLDLSFSLWFFWVATNLGYLLLRQAGVPITDVQGAQAGVGGCAAWCLLILWTGRSWYGAALRAAFRPSADPALAEAAGHVRVLLVAALAMVLALVALGCGWWPALLAVLLFLGAFLVLSRIFAEAGVPFFGLPGYGINQVIFGLVGVQPLAGLVPMTLIGMTLLADSREGLMPYATHAGFLAERTGVPQGRLSRLLFVAVLIAMAVSAATMLWLGYQRDGHADTYYTGQLMDQGLTLSADTAFAQQEGLPRPAAAPWGAYATGAAIVAGIGLARLHWSGFVLHPIGFLTTFNYATWVLAFSFFLGWLAKLLVLRYGGVGLYKRLKPIAIGIVAGEAAASGLFIVVISLAKALGWAIASEPQFMPR